MPALCAEDMYRADVKSNAVTRTRGLISTHTRARIVCMHRVSPNNVAVVMVNCSLR